MFTKKYTFADITIGISSETEIENSEPCLPFISNDEADFAVNLIQGKLPQKSGSLLFEKRNHTCFKTADGYAYYSSYNRYPEAGQPDYACFIPDENGGTLFIDYEDGLWDTMVLDALNISAILIKNKRELILHASCVEYNGNAVIFTAPKQTGKSTQAELWRKYAGADIINGDRIAIGMKGGSVYAYGTPYRGSSGIGKNAVLPVASIVKLGKAEKNKLSPLSPVEAYTTVLGGITCDSEIEELAVAAADVTGEIVTAVPFFSFECTKDESAVTVLKNEIDRITGEI